MHDPSIISLIEIYIDDLGQISGLVTAALTILEEVLMATEQLVVVSKATSQHNQNNLIVHFYIICSSSQISLSIIVIINPG